MGNDVSNTAVREQILNDLHSRTQFSSREIRRLYQCFRADCRKYGHGHKLQMNQAEFTQILVKTLRADADFYDSAEFSSDDESFIEVDDEDFAKFAEHAFRSYDMDNNGHIDFDEFVLSLDMQVRSSLRSRVENLFRFYDIDGNNRIEREEAREILQVMHTLRLGCLPKEDVVTPDLLTNIIFKRADVDGDDVICQREFMRAALKSDTLRAVLEGTSFALSEPFVVRAGVKSRPTLMRTLS